MSKTTKRRVLVAAPTIVALAVLFVDGLPGVAGALGEYLRPTTVEAIPLRQGSVETGEPPPADLMRIVETQKALYNLALQKVVVYRSPFRVPALERRFAGLPLGEEALRRWRPLSRGCCSCQFGRHVIVLVADSTEKGSVLVEAALVQSRGDFLRLKWDSVLGSWVWRWCQGGVLSLI
jgi:hypothetical protein